MTHPGRASASSVLLLVIVLLAGAALRVRGLDWGLPWALHIDERLFVAEKAIELERSLEEGGLPDPGITSYGILPLWLVVGVRSLFLDAAMQSGPPTYGNELAGTILLARIVSAAAGVLAILATWAWARRFGPRVAIVAAALVAGFPALVQASHFGTVESLLVLGMAAGMLAAERLAERPSIMRAVAAGLAWGAALSVKSPAVFLALPLVHAAPRRFPIVAGSALALMLALNPRMAAAPLARMLPAPPHPQERVAPPRDASPEHETFFGNFRRAYSGSFHDWTLAYANDVPIVTELTRILPWGIGVLAEVAAGVGLVLAIRRPTPAETRALLLFVPLFASLLAVRAKTIRFYLPAFPALAVLAARGAAWSRILAVVVVAATFLHGAALTSIYVDEDARIAAARWFDTHVGPRERVVIEDPPGYGPPLGSPTSELPRAPMRTDILWRNFYSVHERRTETERRAHLDEMLAKADWIALSEGHRAEYTAAGARRPVESCFYEDLDAGRLPFRIEATFKSHPRLGPFVLSDDRAEVLMRVFDHPRIEIWRRVAGVSSEAHAAADSSAAP